MGITWKIIFIDGITLIFKAGFCIKRNIGFREMFVNAKSITAKKMFIECYCIERCIAKECF